MDLILDNMPALISIIHRALEEDLGPGDWTTAVSLEKEINGKAILLSREEIVLAGLPIFKRVFLELYSPMEFEDYYEEGNIVPPGKNICVLKGPLSSILNGERTALNFIQRMSGIATLTRRYVEKVKSFGVEILDTRKTAPGLRLIDKYSVRIGGALNHRFGLFDGILIKENHITAVGSIRKAVENAKKNVPHSLKIEVEVEDIMGAKEALIAGADIILLDNMRPSEVQKVVEHMKEKVLLEVSGNVTLDTVEAYAKTGIDYISVGSLTHSAKAADFSLRITNE
jgi:nicotinate-nucleotide pyrophosphorylase (carboxylating)